jgi:tetratricopeptide (TPR) repeat protein
MPLEVLVRFARWDEILAEPDNYSDYMPFTRAFHYAARAAKGDVSGAKKEQAVYLERAKLVPKDEFFGNNTAEAILAIVTHMLEGEILIREGNLEAGIAVLRSAVKNEDTLRYHEPPGWLIPVRHSLGASLMQASRFAEAEQVYREDLERLPQNGWSLFGSSSAQHGYRLASTARATLTNLAPK